MWAIILLPLAGAVFNGLFGRRLGRSNVAFVAVAVMVGAFLISAAAFFHVLASPHGEALHFRGDTWFRVVGPDGRAIVSIAWGLLVDRLSGTMIMVVTGIGTLIHVYSISYMSHESEAGFARFFTYLNLFVAAMLTLVLGDTLVLTFVGWEGVGLCSYLLIGFWFTDEEKAFAGRKAFVTNRIGDFGFLLGLFTLFSVFGTATYGDIAQAAAALDPNALIQGGLFTGWTFGAAITLAVVMLFVGATGKSAQLPLYVWLPDAMAGPTPVSALIHAATMVTAGVYLVARNSFLYSLAPTAMAIVTMVGACTALFAAVIAFVQTDIKKVLAYSTVSQLGFMFIGVGSGVYWAGVLHLVTHALFKGCLFLGAGSVMHGMGDRTDIREMGGLAKKMPQTAWTFGIATVAATGILPLSGFFSKDGILAGAQHTHNPAAAWVGPAAYVIGTVAALGTAFYMTRLFVLTFLGKPRSPHAEHAHESSPVMYVPLWILAIGAIVAAVLGLPALDLVPERLQDVFGRFTDPVFEPAYEHLKHVGHLTEVHESILPFLFAWLVAAAGTAIAWFMYKDPATVPARLADAFPRLYQLAYDKFRVDELYEAAVLNPVKSLARGLWKIVDVGIIDGLFVNGVPRAVAFAGSVVRLAQNGDVQRYAALMAIAAAAILFAVLGGVTP